MDRLTIIGLITALVAILGGQTLEGGSLEALFDPAAFVIVVFGSLGAVMVQTHWSTFKRAMSITPWIFKTPVPPIKEGVMKITAWSQLTRKDGLLALEKTLDDDMDPFILKGLNMLVDGNDAEAIRQAMFVELDIYDRELLKAAKIFESLGGYSPTLGIVGAVLGLIHVMGNLSNPELLGAGIATAFVATIYGVGFANLIFLPVYHKLRAVIATQSQYREMIIGGVCGIANGENPRVIESRLNGYVV